MGGDDIYRWLWPSRRLLAEKFFFFQFFFAFGPALSPIWISADDFEPQTPSDWPRGPGGANLRPLIGWRNSRGGKIE